jgi:hypothetical protein
MHVLQKNPKGYHQEQLSASTFAPNKHGLPVFIRASTAAQVSQCRSAAAAATPLEARNRKKQTRLVDDEKKW